MVKERPRKPGRKAPPRVEDIAAGKPAPASDDAGATDADEVTEAEPDEPASNPTDTRHDDPSVLANAADSGSRVPGVEEALSDEALPDVIGSGASPDASGTETSPDAPETDDLSPDASGPSSDAAALEPSPDASGSEEPSDASGTDEPPDASGPSSAAVPIEASPDVITTGEDASEASATDLDASDPDADPADPADPLVAMLAEFDAPRPATPPGVQLTEEIPIDPEDDLRAVEGEASLRLVSIVESLLFAAARPLRVQDFRKVLAETSKHQIQLALKHLVEITSERGVMLAQVAGGFQLRTHPDNAVWVQKLLQAKPARLSRTQIETLAIVAYRQPITRPEIDDVRGVDSGAVLKTLLERELIQIVGRKEEPGRPLLYGTTVRFLEFFNLRSLRDLPTLRDFRDLSEESKATVRAKFGESEAEAMGQGVLDLDADDDDATATTDDATATADDATATAVDATATADDATATAVDVSEETGARASAELADASAPGEPSSVAPERDGEVEIADEASETPDAIADEASETPDAIADEASETPDEIGNDASDASSEPDPDASEPDAAEPGGVDDPERREDPPDPADLEAEDHDPADPDEHLSPPTHTVPSESAPAPVPAPASDPFLDELPVPADPPVAPPDVAADAPGPGPGHAEDELRIDDVER